MPIEALLPLVTYPDASNNSVPVNGARMAHQLGAKLYSLALEVEVPDVSNALSEALLDIPKLIRDAETNSRARGEQLLRIACDNAQSLGIEHEEESVRIREPEFGPTAAIAARYHDLSLIGWEPTNRSARVVAEALIFDSGRPVMLLPDALPQTIGHIAVAWDGSRVAARAISDALRLLGNAKSASVILVTDEKAIQDTSGAERLAEYLARHNLQSSIHHVRSAGRSIGETLQAEAQKLGADLLVMGAYGHSRLRQFVLGGATRGILEDLQMPVLLSH